MCGIAGILPLDGARPDEELLDRMVAAIGHRGPDGRGRVCRPGIGLGHARLAIIDPEGGAQPMASADGTLLVTFNGEIFNYVELREELIARGHAFRTASDTEVLLHLYEAEGDAFVERLNGQWAFALWDGRRRRLLLSRDRLGVRPLFHATAGGALLFASEIKAILASPAVSRELDLTALDQVFTFWSARAPRTMFSHIRALPPAHTLVVEGGTLTERPYWQIDYAAGDGRPLLDEAYVERTRALLDDATRLRLRSDVPVAAYLSGGLDSTLVTALARRAAGRRLRTFSLTFDDPGLDEREAQDIAVRSLDVDHTTVSCTATDVGRVFPDVIRHIETPVLRTGPAPMYLLSRHVRDAGFKVALTGEGADELFGGYDLFKELKVRLFCAADPASPLRSQLFRHLYPYLPQLQRQSDSYRAAFFESGTSPEADWFYSHRPRWRAAARLRSFYSPDVRAALAGWDALEDLSRSLPREYARWDPMSRAFFLETTQLLPGYILASQGDRVGLAHGVETRFPFLDPHVVDFAAGVPARLKIRGLTEKYLLKRAAVGLVPAAVRHRPKQPYRGPGLRAFFGPAAPDYVAELLSADQVARFGLFQPSAVAALVRKCRAGAPLGNSDDMALAGILSTQLFCHAFLRDSNSGGSGAGDIHGAAALHH
jgi:asparagine synthase (glutamine-hydrolysing)